MSSHSPPTNLLHFSVSNAIWCLSTPRFITFCLQSTSIIRLPTLFSLSRSPRPFSFPRTYFIICVGFSLARQSIFFCISKRNTPKESVSFLLFNCRIRLESREWDDKIINYIKKTSTRILSREIQKYTMKEDGKWNARFELCNSCDLLDYEKPLRFRDGRLKQ